MTPFWKSAFVGSEVSATVKTMPGAVHPFERLRHRLRPSEEEGRRHRGPFKKDKGDRKPEPRQTAFFHIGTGSCGTRCSTN